MTSSIQFSGLSSGLDTASIISSLMEVEALPQTALKNRLATTQSENTALQQINTALASLSTSAKSFATGSTWKQLSATSTSSAVTATASSSATPASFSFTVGQPATAGRTTITADQFASVSGSGLTLTANGKSVTLDPAGSMADLATAINATAKTSGVQAHVVKSTTGDVLLISSSSTGAASNFTLGDGTTTFTGTGGQDASITLDGGITVTSASNTFTGLMSGIDVTLGASVKAGDTASVTVAADGASRATAVKAFIGQLNDVLKQISSTTAYGTITAGQASAGGGVLPGDSSLRAVADQLINTVFPGGKSTMATYGLSIDRYGQFTFDPTTFTAAYEADPDGVQAAFTGTGGFAGRVQKVADLASDAYEGSISQYIKSQKTEIDRYNDQITAWDDRLAAKQASLQQIYTALETQMSKLSAQQSWLTSQIEGLDGLSSSKN